jgi:hypothetical protein
VSRSNGIYNWCLQKPCVYTVYVHICVCLMHFNVTRKATIVTFIKPERERNFVKGSLADVWREIWIIRNGSLIPSSSWIHPYNYRSVTEIMTYTVKLKHSSADEEKCWFCSLQSNNHIHYCPLRTE